MKDVTFCLAEMLERGWIGGVEKEQRREVIRLRQPQVDHIQNGLKKNMDTSDVTVGDVMRNMDLDYFTAYHVIKNLERERELIPDEGVFSLREWRWNKGRGEA